MKRKGYLYEQIYDINNLILAEKNARKGKSKQHGVIKFDKNKQDNLINLHHVLLNNEFNTSNYRTFKLYEKKERLISELPYYPDRILQHALVNVTGNTLIKSFTKDTYSCIKKRGILLCLNNLRKALKDIDNTTYCMKLDIKKYFLSIDHEILKSLLNRKFKDKRILNLFYNIIDSYSPGIPLGNYTSQLFGNLYLNGLIHYLKEELKIKYVFLYCDDLIVLGNNKNELRIILNKIEYYLNNILKLELSNKQIFPIKSRGIDFLGYKSYHNYRLLRKSIKLKWINMLKYYPNKKSKASYNGWLSHSNTINLQNKYLNGKNNNKKEGI
jgi:RNA-directed DNA polymerase